MTTGALKQLIATQVLTAAAATYYTAPASSNGYTVVTSFVICNTDSAERTFTVHAVASGGAAATGNKILDAVTIAADTTYIVGLDSGMLVLPSGSFIQALADSANVVTITAAGTEYT